MTRQPNPRQLKIERAEIDYLEALDAGDLDRIAELWQQAESDPDLTAAFLGLSEGLNEEAAQQTPSFERDAETVREAVAANFSPRAEPVDPTAPLRAKDVAARVKQDAQTGKLRLTAADLSALDALLQRDEPLPDSLTQPAVERWAAQLGATFGKNGAREFKNTAISLSLARSQQASPGSQTAHLLAARQANPAAAPLAKSARRPAASPPSPKTPIPPSGSSDVPKDDAAPDDCGPPTQ
ncbi:MAG TPA: hypothetical protein VGE52_04410 [Pirellulales bacterium]